MTDEAKFTAMVETLSDRLDTAAPVAVRKQLGLQHKLPVPEIQDLFHAVKDATTSSKKADYVPLEDTLFPEDVIRRWRREKTNIKRVLETHESALEAMQKSQKKCWSYRSKAKKYHVMMDTARAALAYCEPDTAEYRARGATIRDLERDLTRRRGTLAKYVLDYEGHVLHELTIRGRIHRMAIALESDIRAQTRDVIVDHVGNLPAANCRHSLNPSEICRRLYDVTSRTYIYTAPPPNVSDANFNTPVVLPHIEDSVFQIYAHASPRPESVTQPSPISSITQPSPISSVTQPSPISSITQPSPISSADQPDLPASSDSPTKEDLEPKTRQKPSGWRRVFQFSWRSRK